MFRPCIGINFMVPEREIMIELFFQAVLYHNLGISLHCIFMHNLEELAFKHMSRNEENVSVSLFFYVCFCEPSIGDLKRSLPWMQHACAHFYFTSHPMQTKQHPQ